MSAQPKDFHPPGKRHSGQPAPERAPLLDLESYPEPFVKTEDLARYWYVSPRQIYKQIENGKLPAIRVGPRTVRILTRDAADFEKQLMLRGPFAEACADDKQRAGPQRHRGGDVVDRGDPPKRRIRR